MISRVKPFTLRKIVRTLVVEDSPVVRELLVYMLKQDPNIEVVGTAGDGQQAIDMVRVLRPDVVTMDVTMPKMDGLEATRRIMAQFPVPIIIVSAAVRPEEVKLTFDAMAAGAVAILEKPYGPSHADHQAMADHLRKIVRIMSEVKVVQRRPPPLSLARAKSNSAPVKTDSAPGYVSPATRAHGEFPSSSRAKVCATRVVAIGASTGGPPALLTLLSAIRGDFPAALLIVQHMAPGFIQGMLDWLRPSTGLELRLATHGDLVCPGVAYIAPDGYHMGLLPDWRISLVASPREHGLCPSASHLFRSVASVCGAASAGVLLTGMGRDGAEELGLIRNAGGLTIAQDAASSVIHGMPGEAIKLGHAQKICSVESIASELLAWTHRR